MEENKEVIFGTTAMPSKSQEDDVFGDLKLGAKTPELGKFLYELEGSDEDKFGLGHNEDQKFLDTVAPQNEKLFSVF